MDNGFDIKSLPEKMKRDLIDYIDDLPKDIAVSVKMALNDPEMDPSLWKDRKRILSRFATVTKYLSDKCHIISNAKAVGSFYQEEYCMVVEKIENMVPDKRGELLYLMRIPCYNVEHLLLIEREVANMISGLKNCQNAPTIVNIICGDIIPYKLKALAVNQRLSEIMDGFPVVETDEYPPILHVHNMIMNAIRYSDNSFGQLHNIAVLIYIYFRMLFMKPSVVYTHGFLDRFAICIISSGKNINAVEDTFHKLTEYNPPLSVAEASSKLYNIKEIEQLGNPTPISKTVESTSIRKLNNFIFFMKDASVLDQLDEDLTSIILKKTTINFIAYCMNQIRHLNSNENTITFYISDNDIGHIMNACKCSVGNVTDILERTMMNIIYYENELYVLFTDYANRGSIFGINIPQKSVDDRKILEITKDRSTQYKFVSII